MGLNIGFDLVPESEKESATKINFTKYRPIPYGGFKLLLNFSLLIPLSLFAINFLREIFAGPITGWEYDFGALVLSIMVLGIWIFVGVFINDITLQNSNPFSFLKQYWKQNIISYYMGYKQDLEQEGHIFLYVIDTDGKLIFRDGSRADRIHFSGYSLAFPLGGWFKEPHIIDENNQPATSYKVRLRKPFDEQTVPLITVTDRDGVTVQWNAWKFLLFLNQFCKPGEKVDGNLVLNTWDFRHALHGLVLQVEERRKEVLKLGEERSSLTDAIVIARDAIEATTRFGKSKDAKQIREALDKALEKIGDPRADATCGSKPKPPQVPSRIGDII